MIREKQEAKKNLAKLPIPTSDALRTRIIQYLGLMNKPTDEKAEPHSNRHTDRRAGPLAGSDSEAGHPQRIGGPWKRNERQMVS